MREQPYAPEIKVIGYRLELAIKKIRQSEAWAYKTYEWRART